MHIYQKSNKISVRRADGSGNRAGGLGNRAGGLGFKP